MDNKQTSSYPRRDNNLKTNIVTEEVKIMEGHREFLFPGMVHNKYLWDTIKFEIAVRSNCTENVERIQVFAASPFLWLIIRLAQNNSTNETNIQWCGIVYKNGASSHNKHFTIRAIWVLVERDIELFHSDILIHHIRKSAVNIVCSTIPWTLPQ